MAKANHPRPMTIGQTILRHTMVVFISLFLANQVWADAAGTELAERVYDRPDGEDASFAITMTLTEKGHSPRVRKLILYRLNKKAGEVSTLIRFTEPADIKGTGLLTQDRAGGDSNQWIYLPALERVRRIDSNRKGSRFVNSGLLLRRFARSPGGQESHQWH